MDLAADPFVEEIGVLKAAQIGWSEAERNVFGYWVDLNPGPLLIVAANQKAAEDYARERLEPLLRNTPALAKHLSARLVDTTKHTIRLDTMTVYLAWAGSESGLKSRPIRYVSIQEPDDLPLHSGVGGSPIAKARKRQTTYADKGLSKALIGGTPTNRLGYMWRWWETCPTRCRYYVPCPHCGKYQRLVWGETGDGPGVKWRCDEPDRAKRADMVRGGNLAWYQCEFCRKAIHDHHKPAMLRGRKLVSETQAITPEGVVSGERPRSRKVGVQIPAMYSPWVPFSTLAAEWIEAQGDPAKLADFINQRLAEPFEEQRAKTEPSLFEQKARGGPPAKVVPKWARLLIASADTQGQDERTGFFYYAVRAWAYDYRSQLVDYGICQSREELKRICLDTPYQIAGGGQAAPQYLFVDSGGPRWSAIYELAFADPMRVKPTKGAAHEMRWMVEEKRQRAHSLDLWMIDTSQAKDLLYRLIHDPDATRWMLCREVNEDYCRQMSAETKILNPTTGKEEWHETSGRANHYWDAEAIQCAAAWRLGAAMPAPPTEAPHHEQDDPARVAPGDWMQRRKW